MKRLSISAIICTHNPRPDYLRRVLDALKAQTLPKEQWELLFIDNASKEVLAGKWDLSWHPQARHVREGQLGKVQALMAGIKEADGGLLVIVDDDNVLDPGYLAACGQISRDWPFLGAWGGSIVAEFEEPPPKWAKPYLRYLAIREVTHDQWSNLSDPKYFGLLPWGAGMCVRRQVAEKWAARTSGDAMLRKLDRQGGALLCGEDTHMALSACDLGLGTGLFSSLRLRHLIHAGRLREEYLIKLLAGQVYSLCILSAIRGRTPERVSWPRFIWGHVTALRRGFRAFRFYHASVRASQSAAGDLRHWMGSAHSSRPDGALERARGAVYFF